MAQCTVRDLMKKKGDFKPELPERPAQKIPHRLLVHIHQPGYLAGGEIVIITQLDYFLLA